MKNEFDKETNQAIIKKHEAFLKTINGFLDLIEFFRGEAANLVESAKFQKVTSLLSFADEFGVETTKEDIKKAIGDE
jgi:hypothetical protein